MARPLFTHIPAFERPFVAPQQDKGASVVLAADTLRSIVLLAALCTGLLQTAAFKARGVGPRAGISMAAQRPEARRLLLRGQRLENPKQMKAFTLRARLPLGQRGAGRDAGGVFRGHHGRAERHGPVAGGRHPQQRRPQD